MADHTFGPNGWTPERLGSLEGKTYLITGANSGTGFEATRTFLSKGARVVMLNRSAEKSNAAIANLKQEFGSDADVTFVRMDLADMASVRKAAAEVLDQVPRIDALICNAAIAQVPTQKFTVDGFESQLGTNHYGHFLLSGLLFERVEESKGRIVVVASLGYKMGIKTIQFDDMNWDKNYHQNKHLQPEQAGADDVCLRAAGSPGSGTEGCQGLRLPPRLVEDIPHHDQRQPDDASDVQAHVSVADGSIGREGVLSGSDVCHGSRAGSEGAVRPHRTKRMGRPGRKRHAGVLRVREAGHGTAVGAIREGNRLHMGALEHADTATKDRSRLIEEAPRRDSTTSCGHSLPQPSDDTSKRADLQLLMRHAHRSPGMCHIAHPVEPPISALRALPPQLGYEHRPWPR